MKAEEIVAEIAQGPKYVELIECWELVRDNPGPETAEIWGRIYELLRILDEIIYTSRKAFLGQVSRSYYGKNTKPYTIYFIIEPKNVTAAKKAFNSQIKQQMPVYAQLMALMAAKTRAERQKEEAEEVVVSVC